MFSGALPIAAVGVDDAVRFTLDKIFALTPEFRSCGYFEDGKQAVLAFPEIPARLVVIELGLRDACGMLCARQLLSLRPGIKVILVTALRHPTFCDRASALGIHRLCLKPLRFSQFLTTLRFVTSPLRRTANGNPKESLTTREEEIVRCLGDGLLYKEIESRLNLTHGVLRKLQHRLFRKLRAENRTEAVKNWRRSQLHWS